MPAVGNIKCKAHWMNRYVASSFVQWEHSEAFWFTSSFQNSVWPTGTSEKRPRPLRNGDEENSTDFCTVFFYFLTSWNRFMDLFFFFFFFFFSFQSKKSFWFIWVHLSSQMKYFFFFIFQYVKKQNKCSLNHLLAKGVFPHRPQACNHQSSRAHPLFHKRTEKVRTTQIKRG